jgi:glycolate oxidase iron-sulfur subunit
MTQPTLARLTQLEIAASADQCVQCGLCLPHCPTYQLDKTEAESPRGRIAYMKALAIGQISPTAAGDLHLDHCLGCRRCESACPAQVAYGDLYAASRADSFSKRKPRFANRMLAKSMATPALAKGLGVLARLSGRLPALPLGNTTTAEKFVRSDSSQVTIFEGCIAKPYEKITREALAKLLAACNIDLIQTPSQQCCGAASAHQGDIDTVQQLAAKNRHAFAATIPVLSLATGCHESLARSLHGHTEVIDALDFLLLHRQHLRFKVANQRIALHIPCTQVSIVKSHTALRSLLSTIPMLEIVELPTHGCCGGAGLHMTSYPERAAAMREPLVSAIDNADVTRVVSANIGCRLHITKGCKIHVQHPIDFLAEHLS